MLGLSASLLTFIFFVPWILIVLIPLFALVWGGTYCLLTAGGCQKLKEYQVTRLPDTRARSSSFESFHETIPA